jgi:hypothetical protein
MGSWKPRKPITPSPGFTQQCLHPKLSSPQRLKKEKFQNILVMLPLQRKGGGRGSSQWACLPGRFALSSKLHLLHRRGLGFSFAEGRDRVKVHIFCYIFAVLGMEPRA